VRAEQRRARRGLRARPARVPLACEEATEALPALAGGDEVPAALAAHVSQCLRCQAELARYRRLLRTLRSLRGDWATPPAGALGAVLAALEQAESSGGRAIRAAYLGGITVAAGAAGMFVWFNRRRLGLAG
jgi:hypothetical protein